MTIPVINCWKDTGLSVLPQVTFISQVFHFCKALHNTSEALVAFGNKKNYASSRHNIASTRIVLDSHRNGKNLSPNCKVNLRAVMDRITTLTGGGESKFEL
jgi:hypothetical protein